MASHPAVLVVFGLFIGFIGSLVGIGGGFFMVPYFTEILGWSPVAASGTSLGVITANAASGAADFSRQRRIDYRIGLVLGCATLPGAWFGRMAGELLSGSEFRIAFGVMVAIAAMLMVSVRKDGAGPAFSFLRGTPRTLTDVTGTRFDYSIDWGSAALLSVAVGFCSSLFGVGGGFLHVPILVLLYGLPVHVAMATAQLILLITAAAGAAFYGKDGLWMPTEMLCIGAGAVIGAQVGSRTAARSRPAWLRRIFAAIMVVMAALMVWKGLPAGPRP